MRDKRDMGDKRDKKIKKDNLCSTLKQNVCISLFSPWIKKHLQNLCCLNILFHFNWLYWMHKID
jgi:hypothetical protein